MSAGNKLLFLTMLWTLLLAACREEERITAYRQLRTLPPAELDRRVTALSPQEQVKTYVLAISYFKPPDTQLAAILAKQGTRILPALVTELEKADAGVSPQELVLVLDLMATKYQVAEAKALAPRVNGWCSRFYKEDSYCHQMGREMMASRSAD